MSVAVMAMVMVVAVAVALDVAVVVAAGLVVTVMVVAMVAVMMVAAVVRLPVVAAAAVAATPVTRASTVADVAPAPCDVKHFMFYIFVCSWVHPVAVEINKRLALLGCDLLLLLRPILRLIPVLLLLLLHCISFVDTLR